ncbi:hypothetical protein M569_06863, partial [Genlisea aurea]
EEKRRDVIALTGAAALLAVAVNFAVAALNSHLKKNHRKKGHPGNNVRINLSASEIIRLADHTVSEFKEVHDIVASVPLDKVVTYANSVQFLAELEAQHFPLIQSCTFPKLISASEDIRKASSEAERRIDDYVSGFSKKEDVYRVIKAFATKGDLISSEAKRFVQNLVKDFALNGLDLTSTKRGEFQCLRNQIEELSMIYIRNLNEDSSFLQFNEAELAGLPAEFLKSLDRAGNGKLKVLLKSHHVSPILELCKIIAILKVGSTRKSVAVSYGRRCDANISVLEKLIQLRQKLARLLGFSNYAEYAVNGRMANTSTKVIEFLEKISASLTESAAKELSLLKEMKRKEEGDSPFGMEDMPFYVKKIKEQHLDLNFGVIKQYFPINLVLSGIFKIIQDVFGLRFEEVTDAEVWHKDVQLFSVVDMHSGELMGYFYLDIYSRFGKYGHTCVVALQNSTCINSTRQLPVALLISQLQRESDGRPGLLRFSEVVNLFHEFGHVVHHICNRATFARFSGLRLDPDFIEIPSLLLENWCFETESLKLISGFYQDISKPLEEELCLSLKRWRFSFSSLKIKQEILYCLFDQIIHSSENIDMVGLFSHLHPKVMVGLPMLEGTNPASCFPRTAVGYEGTCYSRLWSEVVAADIFSSVFTNDVFNQNAGIKFRNQVLSPGGKEPSEILSDFLGREPSIQAYIDSR